MRTFFFQNVVKTFCLLQRSWVSCGNNHGLGWGTRSNLIFSNLTIFFWSPPWLYASSVKKKLTIYLIISYAKKHIISRRRDRDTKVKRFDACLCMPYLGLKKFFKAINKCQKCVGKSRLYQLAQINQLQQPIRQSTQSFTFIHSELGTLGPWLLRISLMWFSLMPEIFFLSEMKNCQNGTFEHVHEIQKFFWPKAFF